MGERLFIFSKGLTSPSRHVTTRPAPRIANANRDADCQEACQKTDPASTSKWPRGVHPYRQPRIISRSAGPATGRAASRFFRPGQRNIKPSGCCSQGEPHPFPKQGIPILHSSGSSGSSGSVSSGWADRGPMYSCGVQFGSEAASHTGQGS